MDGDRTKLIIEKAERKESALFTCTAVNDYGEDSMNIQLTVQGECGLKITTGISLNFAYMHKVFFSN